MAIMTLSSYSANGGGVFLTLGLKHGKGGIVQAVENMKAVWQTLIVLLLTKGNQMPTFIQVIGMLLGLFGTSIIFMNKTN